MTESEAIKQFKERIDIPDYKKQIPEYYEAMEIAINALGKQIPKKPKSITPVENSMYVKCPTCKLTTVLYDGCIMEYCKNCGQKLDWSDEE